jgi:protein ImuA
MPLDGENQPRSADIEALRGLLSRSVPAATGQPCLLGLPLLDAALGGGLPTGCLQEVIGGEGTAAAGFCAFLLGRLVAHEGAIRETSPKAILWGWIGEGDLYPPGLASFGLDPAQAILLSAPNSAELLWAMEEGLRSPALAGVAMEAQRLDLVASRRLQLAAATGGVTGFLLTRGRPSAVSAAALRWRVSGLQDGRWQVVLERRRGGRPGAWILEKNDETDHLTVAAELADGSFEPAPAAAG